MFDLHAPGTGSEADLSVVIPSTVRQITEGETDLIANLANTASVLFHLMPEVNWAGFYLFDGTELVLGPFHGRPACIRIAVGRGVCGTAVATRSTQLVEDVEAFPGHIACDAASRSELVVPMIHRGRIVGVLDIDSPQLARFTRRDAEMAEAVVAILLERSFGVDA
jgi:GAF domain-containing protein